jgi:hypothetical protein
VQNPPYDLQCPVDGGVLYAIHFPPLVNKRPERIHADLTEPFAAQVTWEKTSCPVYMLDSENIRARSMTRMVFPVQDGNTHKMIIFI